MQFHFCEFRGKEFFNSHRRLHSLTLVDGIARAKKLSAQKRKEIATRASKAGRQSAHEEGQSQEKRDGIADRRGKLALGSVRYRTDFGSILGQNF